MLGLLQGSWRKKAELSMWGYHRNQGNRGFRWKSEPSSEFKFDLGRGARGFGVPL